MEEPGLLPDKVSDAPKNPVVMLAELQGSGGMRKFQEVNYDRSRRIQLRLQLEKALEERSSDLEKPSLIFLILTLWREPPLLTGTKRTLKDRQKDRGQSAGGRNL